MPQAPQDTQGSSTTFVAVVGDGEQRGGMSSWYLRTVAHWVSMVSFGLVPCGRLPINTAKHTLGVLSVLPGSSWKSLPCVDSLAVSRTSHEAD